MKKLAHAVGCQVVGCWLVLLATHVLDSLRMTSLSAAHLKHLARVEQIKPVEPIVFEETAQSQYLVG